MTNCDSPSCTLCADTTTSRLSLDEGQIPFVATVKFDHETRVYRSIDDATPAEWDEASRRFRTPAEVQAMRNEALQRRRDVNAGRDMPEGSIGDINSSTKGSGARFNAGKPSMDLIPLRIIAESYEVAQRQGTPIPDLKAALRFLGAYQETQNLEDLMDALLALGPLKDTWAACARVFAYGKKKYAAWNWAKGMAWSVPLACACRHAMAVLEGEDTDPESKELHVGHIACNIVMLMTFACTYREGDDLPKVLTC